MGKGILAMDESNGTCGICLESIGVENTEANRLRWRETLLGTKGLGDFCGGAILFTETLYQDTTDGKKMVDLAKENGVIPVSRWTRAWCLFRVARRVKTGAVALTTSKS